MMNLRYFPYYSQKTYLIDISENLSYLIIIVKSKIPTSTAKTKKKINDGNSCYFFLFAVETLNYDVVQRMRVFLSASDRIVRIVFTL